MSCDSKLSFADSEWTLLFQGAESRVYEGEYKKQSAILKNRFQKQYRLPELDRKLTKGRIKSEIKAYKRIADKCKNVHETMCTILHSDDRNIIFSKIEDACNLSQYIFKCQREEKFDSIDQCLKHLAQLIAQLHLANLIHGDLTTSNFMIKQTDQSDQSIIIIPIDFGLSYTSASDEDRAVDLYVLERAVQSTHPGLNFDVFLQEYLEKMSTDKINKRLDQVRMRGRKRLMIG